MNVLFDSVHNILGSLSHNVVSKSFKSLKGLRWVILPKCHLSRRVLCPCVLCPCVLGEEIAAVAERIWRTASNFGHRHSNPKSHRPAHNTYLWRYSKITRSDVFDNSPAPCCPSRPHRNTCSSHDRLSSTGSKKQESLVRNRHGWEFDNAILCGTLRE